MAGLIDKLGKIDPDDISAAMKKIQDIRLSADREVEKQVARVELETLAGLIEKAYAKPLQDMGLVAFSRCRDLEPVHLGAEPAGVPPGFSGEGRYMLPMIFRGGSAESHTPPSLDYSDSFSIELGCDTRAEAEEKHLKINAWIWAGRQKYVRDETIKCLIPVPDGAVTVKLAHEHDLESLHEPLVKELTVWLEAFAARDPVMKDRLTKATAVTTTTASAPIPGEGDHNKGQEKDPPQQQASTA